MESLLGVIALATFSARAELTVLPEAFATNHVADGATAAQAGRLEIATEGRLYKTGGGTWTIPERNIDQHNALARAHVRDGRPAAHDALAAESVDERL